MGKPYVVNTSTSIRLVRPTLKTLMISSLLKVHLQCKFNYFLCIKCLNNAYDRKIDDVEYQIVLLKIQC